MAIQWFPGHMNKARREIADAMHGIDLVIEVLDARLPKSSENPMIASLRGGRPCLRILNKSDLADPEVTSMWLRAISKEAGMKAIALSLRTPAEAKIVPSICRQLVPDRGTPLKPLRVMILGIPNVGKSTLINALAGKKIARVADEPAVTRMQQQIGIGKGILIVDTPGITWPKFDSESGGYHLAATGAIGRNAMDPLDVAKHAADYLVAHYPDLLKARHACEFPDGVALLEEIARRRGCLAQGGVLDLDKAAEILLHELRSGKLGRISLEKPEAH